MKIKSIIEELLANHERGSTEYLAGYILRMSDGRLGQSQAQQYASMFNEYAQFIYNPDSYTGIYKKVFENLNTDDFGTGVCKYIEEAGLGSFEDGESFLDGLEAVEGVLVRGDDIDTSLEEYGLYEAEDVTGEVETGVSQFWEPRFERTIDVEDAYSEAEVEELQKIMEDEL